MTRALLFQNKYGCVNHIITLFLVFIINRESYLSLGHGMLQGVIDILTHVNNEILGPIVTPLAYIFQINCTRKILNS